jgi:peptidoglycan/LPS O-acetylase OafA/YrhL
MKGRPPQPTPWWVPILLSFLGLTACFLLVAYISWIQVDGHIYWFGLAMVLINLAVLIAAVVATGMDARTGRVSWRWWAVLGSLVLASMILFPLMGTWA